MKKIFRKNQIIIAALAVMIAAAGYLNYSGRLFGEKDDAAQTSWPARSFWTYPRRTCLPARTTLRARM